MTTSQPYPRPRRIPPSSPPSRQRSRLKPVLIMSIILLGLVVTLRIMFHHTPALTDYIGEGKQDILIEIHAGDSTQNIAENLEKNHIIATIPVFLDAAHNNPNMAIIQPGFYKLRTEIPALTAVNELLNPANRVGKVIIPEGRQLDDIYAKHTNTRTPGLFSLIAQASCVELNHTTHCISAEELRQVAATQSLDALKIPSWARSHVSTLPGNYRRLEGLILAGTWNINPQSSPTEILATLINDTNDMLAENNLHALAQQLNLSPYELLTVASLVQRESLPQDFAKVARVIYNRLAIDQRLEFDSTVNYPLEHQHVTTSDQDRHTLTLWNTYTTSGLPRTPICSPGIDALHAAEFPEPGDWLYFVTIDDQGTTVFTHSFQEHLTNIDQALHNGILDESHS